MISPFIHSHAHHSFIQFPHPLFIYVITPSFFSTLIHSSLSPRWILKTSLIHFLISNCNHPLFHSSLIQPLILHSFMYLPPLIHFLISCSCTLSSFTHSPPSPLRIVPPPPHSFILWNFLSIYSSLFSYSPYLFQYSSSLSCSSFIHILNFHLCILPLLCHSFNLLDSPFNPSFILPLIPYTFLSNNNFIHIIHPSISFHSFISRSLIPYPCILFSSHHSRILRIYQWFDYCIFLYIVPKFLTPAKAML